MELHELTAVQAAEMIRSRQLSPVEYLQALLGRIDALEPSMRAWVTVDRERAMEAARRQENEMPGGRPLFGVPVAVKDIFFTAGLATASGSPAFADFVPDRDATSVARVRGAGGNVVGKTVTVQWAFADPPVTRNPWNPDRTPGGSSSGSAVAVATRMVPVALGSQTGGSILRPAAFCGIVGLKPTYGRVSRYGVTPSSWSVDHIGPLTRTVEDAALMLQVMAGPDPNDPASAKVPVGDYLAAARKRDRAPVLGLVADYLDPSSGVSAEVADHVRDVAGRFERAGAEVREVRLPMPLATLVGMRHLMNQVETSEEHFRTLAAHPEGYRPKIRAYVEIGQLVAGPVYLHAQRLRRRARPAMEAMLEGLD